MPTMSPTTPHGPPHEPDASLNEALPDEDTTIVPHATRSTLISAEVDSSLEVQEAITAARPMLAKLKKFLSSE